MALSDADFDNAGRPTRRSVRAGDTHQSLLRYRRMLWAKIAFVGSLVGIVSYLLIDVEPRHNGGGWYGYTLGTLSVLLILWLTMLGVRKRLMTPGRWSLKAWTSAHVYLGLALVVIATLHTGFQLGWNVHTLAWALMMIVVLSGIFGVLAYMILPRRLGSNRDETTEAQMLENVADLDRQLLDAAQPLESDIAVFVQKAMEEDAFHGGVGRRLTGRHGGSATMRALAEIRSRALSGTNAAEEIYDRLDGLLSRKRAALGRIRAHLRYKGLLQIWLFVHVPLTFALLAALSAHIVSVFFYW